MIRAVTASDHLMIAFCVTALAIGQLIFKFVGQRVESLSDLLSSYLLAAMMLAAFALYGASTLVWVLVLRNVPLSYAYVFMALGFVLVPLASHFLFNEPLTSRYVLGAVLISVGCWLATSAGQQPGQ